MASKGQVQSWTEEVICPICLDFFTDPVILECGHNFCRSCITRCWEMERNSCPECREEFADRTIRVNRALANLSEKARKLTLNQIKRESKLHCEEHQEELKLFCETDKKLICVICVGAREHREHRFLPIEEAVEIYKDQIKSSLESLTKMKSDLQEMEQQQKEKISGVREQSHSLQSHITSQFAKLHQILTEKEQRLLRDLREEEEKILNPMEKKLQEIQENLNSIQEKLSKLQERMNKEDNMIFLKGEARRKRRVSDDMQALSVTDGALPVEKFDHPFLLNPALREMFDVLKRETHTQTHSQSRTHGQRNRHIFPLRNETCPPYPVCLLCDTELPSDLTRHLISSRTGSRVRFLRRMIWEGSGRSLTPGPSTPICGH
ncbi:nuclear factor 7, brain-like isoform X2 [Pristis pectinata]|uniref:nuclear factor 7, brain-like isoform X2 n=1 Tax=Pristis pectinata TaxID=685728 RepID=UPI00223E8477|nr:nuclear factor 7, brain-like isoform X2 [Pristis pectinata]